MFVGWVEILRIWPTKVTCGHVCQWSVEVGDPVGACLVYLTERLAVTLEFSVWVGLLRIEDLLDRHGTDGVFAVASLFYRSV